MDPKELRVKMIAVLTAAGHDMSEAVANPDAKLNITTEMNASLIEAAEKVPTLEATISTMEATATEATATIAGLEASQTEVVAAVTAGATRLNIATEAVEASEGVEAVAALTTAETINAIVEKAATKPGGGIATTTTNKVDNLDAGASEKPWLNTPWNKEAEARKVN